MRIHHTTSLLALALTAACGGADAEQGYGYPQQSGPAAPSTIPGRGDSEARVPVVEPAPVAMPAPRKSKPRPQPQTQPQPSPWGATANTTPAKPATPPVASQPPIAQPSGMPPNSGPQVVITPGQNTPPPSQPQTGANDHLTSVYRGARTSAAVTRAGGAAQTGNSALGGSVQRITSTALACSQNNNTPKITRIQPADDISLQPGGTLIVHGLCFGDAWGKLQITLPTQYGRIQAQDAQILDWTDDKILAQLPDSIVKALSGAALIEVASAAGARGTGKEAAFEPRWQLSLLPEVAARVRECVGAGAKNGCIAGGDTEYDSGFSMPKNARCSGIGTCFSSMPEHRDYGNVVHLNGLHYTENDIERPLRGRDHFEVTLQPWMRPSHCDTEVTAFSTDGRQNASATARFDADGVVVDWVLSKVGDPGWLSYRANCKVWVPVGMGAQ